MNIIKLNQSEVASVSGGGWVTDVLQLAGGAAASVLGMGAMGAIQGHFSKLSSITSTGGKVANGLEYGKVFFGDYVFTRSNLMQAAILTGVTLGCAAVGAVIGAFMEDRRDNK